MGLNYGLYASLYLILSLIFMMARRVIPFFIEKGVDESFTPTNKHWLDISSLFLAYTLLKVMHLYPGYPTCHHPISPTRLPSLWLALSFGAYMLAISG